MQTPVPKSEPRVAGLIVLVCLSVWLHAIDTLVTATLAPSLIADLGGVVYINWLITIYEVGAVIAGAVTAVASERLGLRAVYCGATVLYGAGCAVAALAPDMAQVLAGRLLQGLGGGALLTLSYVAIYQWFDERRWNRLFGLVAGVWGVGSLLGPLIGGAFAGPRRWRLVFWLFAALAAALLGLIAWLAPRGRRAGAARTGWPLKSLGLLTVAIGLIAESGVRVGTGASLACVLGGLALLGLTASVDARASVRLLPREVLEPRTPIGAGLAMTFCMAVGTCAFWAYGPLLLKVLFAQPPLVSAWLLTLEALAWTLGTAYVGTRLAMSPTWQIRLGMGIVAAGAGGFALTVPYGTLTGMALCTAAQGLGFGLAWPATVTRIVRLAGSGEALAAGAPATLQRIGYAVGTALAGVFARASGLNDAAGVEAVRAAGVWVFAGFVPVLLLGLCAIRRFTAAET